MSKGTITDYKDPEARAEEQVYILDAITTVVKYSHLNAYQTMAVIEPLCEYARVINYLAIPRD